MRMVRTAAIASLSWAVSMFLVGGANSARADEVADLRANQQLLQSRIDQLAQASPSAHAGVVPAAGPAPTLTGSFPRSFLIPGTDVSLRVGGQGVGTVVWYI